MFRLIHYTSFTQQVVFKLLSFSAYVFVLNVWSLTIFKNIITFK